MQEKEKEERKEGLKGERKLDFSSFRERRSKEGSGKVSWDATIDYVAEAPNDFGGRDLDIPLSLYSALI